MAMTDDPTRGLQTVFHPVQHHNPPKGISENVVLRAYEVYCHVHGAQPAMVDVAKGCRGGFGLGEIIAFLYARSFPREQWRERIEEALEARR